MVQFICAFYSKEIILEQFIMKWIDPFYGCAVFDQNGGGGVSPYLCKTKLPSNGIEFFQGRNISQKDIMGKNGLL